MKKKRKKKKKNGRKRWEFLHINLGQSATEGKYYRKKCFFIIDVGLGQKPPNIAMNKM